MFEGKYYAVKWVEESDSTADMEIEIAASVRFASPFLVKYYESFKEEGKVFIVMELCEQGDMNGLLATVSKNGLMFKKDKVMNIMIQLLLGVEELHNHDMIHRDIKPENTFIDTDHNLKIGDFGLLRQLESSSKKTHSVTGTPFFMAPEIFRGEHYNNKVDIWALGVMLYQICALKLPFSFPKTLKRSECNIFAIGKIVEKGVFDPLPDDVDPDIAGIVHSMLSVDPNKRPSALNILHHSRVREFAEAHPSLLKEFPARALCLPSSPLPLPASASDSLSEVYATSASYSNNTYYPSVMHTSVSSSSDNNTSSTISSAAITTSSSLSSSSAGSLSSSSSSDSNAFSSSHPSFVSLPSSPSPVLAGQSPGMGAASASAPTSSASASGSPSTPLPVGSPASSSSSPSLGSSSGETSRPPGLDPDIAEFIENQAEEHPEWTVADFRREFKETIDRRPTVVEVNYFTRLTKAHKSRKDSGSGSVSISGGGGGGSGNLGSRGSGSGNKSGVSLESLGNANTRARTDTGAGTGPGVRDTQKDIDGSIGDSRNSSSSNSLGRSESVGGSGVLKSSGSEGIGGGGGKNTGPQTSVDIPWKYRSNPMGGYKLSDGDRHVTFISEGMQWRTIFLNMCITEGTYKWTVEIYYCKDKRAKPILCIGAAPPELLVACDENVLGAVRKTSAFMMTVNNVDGVLHTEYMGLKGQCDAPNEETLVPDGAQVDIEVDSQTRTIHYFVKGKRVRRAFRGIVFPLYMGISGWRKPAFKTVAFCRLSCPSSSPINCTYYEAW